MDFNNLIGMLQIALAGLQIKLDHFSKSKKENKILQNDFNYLEDAIKSLELALAETISFVGKTEEREPNPTLANLWKDASHKIRRIPGNAELTNIFFDKYLFWENPSYFRNKSKMQLQRISLENIREQLQILRRTYDTINK